MSGAFYVHGPCLVKVKGNGVNTTINDLVELGLSEQEITISTKFYHKDLRADDFGEQVPPEVLWMGAEASITMTLIYFDSTVLDQCIRESMAGGNAEGYDSMVGFGTPMGGNDASLGTSNHFIRLNLTSPSSGKHWRFPTTYLRETPFVFPVGTKRSAVQLNWRAIPYAKYNATIISPASQPPFTVTNDLLSEGTILWDNTADT